MVEQRHAAEAEPVDVDRVALAGQRVQAGDDLGAVTQVTIIGTTDTILLNAVNGVGDNIITPQEAILAL